MRWEVELKSWVSKSQYMNQALKSCFGVIIAERAKPKKLLSSYQFEGTFIFISCPRLRYLNQSGISLPGKIIVNGISIVLLSPLYKTETILRMLRKNIHLPLFFVITLPIYFNLNVPSVYFDFKKNC